MTDIKQLLSAFERYAYGQSLHTAFTEILDWILLPFKIYDSDEVQQQAFELYRSHPKVDQLTPIILLLGNLAEGLSDSLGELFMQAISNGHNGQYFTPEPLCDIMATMSVANAEAGQTVLDCACGSGRMLLSAAKINRHLLLYGADLDITCCKMALVNMLLNSLTGEIAHMNSLTNEFYRGYKVATVLVKGYHMPCYKEFNQPEFSRIWLKPVKHELKTTVPFEPVRATHIINGVQGSLF